jgi:hypothetical protein
MAAMTIPSTRSTDLGSRYGGPSPATRVVAVAVVAGLVLSGLGFLGWAVFSTSTPQVQSRVTAFSFPSQHEAVARITVERTSEDTAATCVLTAIADDHSVVGERRITVDSGPTTQVLDVSIETERVATTVDTQGCTAPGQTRPR